MKSVFSSQVRGHRREDVFALVTADLGRGDQLDVTSLVQQRRVNYPNNCYTLDLSNNTEVMEKGIKTLLVEFNNSKKRNLTMVQLKVEGSSLSCARDIFDHMFYASGDPIEAQYRDREFYKYALKISENVFVEQDSSKNCRVYPNEEFESYRACDNQFMKVTNRAIQAKYMGAMNCHFFKKTIGHRPSNFKDRCGSLVPIWLSDDFGNVTQQTTSANPGVGTNIGQKVNN